MSVSVCGCLSPSLMQRRISEPNAYIDSLSVAPGDPDDIYDNVANTEPDLEVGMGVRSI